MFENKLLTADPKEHIRRAKILLEQYDDSLLLYSALELRLAIERIAHNQLTLSEDHTMNAKGKSDPKRKKLIMKKIDPESDFDYDIFYIDPKSKQKTYWGEYKNIPEKTVKEIEGKLGNLLHMKLGLKLGIAEDPWYSETRSYLTKTLIYLKERISGSSYYFSYKDLENFEFERK